MRSLTDLTRSRTIQGWTRRVVEGAAVARAKNLSLNRIDLQFASKEACRQMANLRVSGEARMKHPKLVWKYDRGKSDEHVFDVVSDSDWVDWVACRRSRRSTSRGVTVIDGGQSSIGAARRQRSLCRLAMQSTAPMSQQP